MLARLTVMGVVCLAATAHANADLVEAPICGRPEVLRVVAEELAQRGLYAELDPAGVGEITAVDDRTASCAVRVLKTAYDTNARGYAPAQSLEVHSYSVRRLRNGLLVEAIQ